MVVLDPLVGALYERWYWGLFHQGGFWKRVEGEVHRQLRRCGD